MDRSWTPRLKLLQLNVLLLVSANIVCLHGNPVAVDHDLRCVNDYLFTINCTMNIAPSENASDGNSSYWLTFTKRFPQTTLVCTLTKQPGGRHFCSAKSFNPMVDDEDDSVIFTDQDVFKISLCHDRHGSETCAALAGEYTPVTDIKPNAPCCLAVRHNSSQYHFTWNSTYEEFQDSTGLVNSFDYQLHYFKRDKEKISPDINTQRTDFSLDHRMVTPDTEYAARVRTSPNQAFYKGHWSDWSSEVHWRTEPAVSDLPTNTLIRGMAKKWFIPLCVLAPIVLLMCYAPVKKWRPSSFIPTPAPYFHTLYSDYQGDFKSWVITRGDMADVLGEEPSLQIDTMIKCEDVPEEDFQPPCLHQWTEGSAYSNVFDPACDASLWGIPYAVSTIAPPSATGIQTGSPAEGDSGCWHCSGTSSPETDSPWYCNKYCTLSSLAPSSPFTAEHVDKILPTGDNQSGGHWEE